MPYLQAKLLCDCSMGVDSKVETLLTPGIRKWGEYIIKRGVSVDKNLENYSRKDFARLMTAMGHHGYREVVNEFFSCGYCWGVAKITTKFDRYGNLTCRFHEKTVFLTNKKISEIAFGLKGPPHDVSLGIGKLDSSMKKKQHSVRGHWRTIESGKRVWVRAHDRGNLRR